MLAFLPGPVLGVLSGLLYFLNLLVIPLMIICLALLKWICPIKPLRHWLDHINHAYLPRAWVALNSGIDKLCFKTQWEVQGNGELDPNGWYFLTSNHQSWLDILVLESAFQSKVPFMKFFMKRSLLWQLPVAGLACWFMNFPFMRRYSKDYLKKHPEKKGKDLEETKSACEHFQRHPVTIINFIEGGRFKREKHHQQKSPYQHLLKPKAGGMAYVLEAMNHRLHHFIDVTLVYPDGGPNLWDYLCGRMSRIVVHYELRPLPENVMGDYVNNPRDRVKFQRWLNELWKEKDQRIEALLNGTDVASLTPGETDHESSKTVS